MMKLRLFIYELLVNRKPGIAERYHRIHDGSRGAKKVLSWVCLVLINLAYYLFFCRFLGERTGTEACEKVKLPLKESESSLFIKRQGYAASGESSPAVSHILKKVMQYDVISFDVFDTLIFRPFDTPTAVFDLTGQEYGVLDFRNKRQLAEYRERVSRKNRCGDTEIDLEDIWKRLGAETGIKPEEGERSEIQAELSLCRANPVMLLVWKKLLECGKTVIVTSDMYLPEKTISKILEDNGYTGFRKLYLSNTLHKSKADSSIYEEIQKDFPGQKIIHIGDNPASDHDNAIRRGIDAVLYPNVNTEGNVFRAHDMSLITGSAWRGMVNAKLYSGERAYTRLYEYGYVYGGLFVTGYCAFIHRYALEHGIEKLLFLSRDGDILKKAYERMYEDGCDAPEPIYAYWSRKAALKLAAGYDREDYFRRFLYHKTGQGINLDSIISSMGLTGMSEVLFSAEMAEKAYLRMERDYGSETKKIHSAALKGEDILTDRNVWLLRCALEECWDGVISAYEGEIRRSEERRVGKEC